MTTTNEQTETGPDGSPRAHWTHSTERDGSSHWYRHTWPVDDARTSIIDAFLAARPDDKDGWLGSDMRIIGDDGETVAHLVSRARMEGMEEAARQIERMKDQPDTANTHPALHGPHTGGDNLLIDTDAIREILAWEIARYILGAFAKGNTVTREQIKAEADHIEETHSAGLIGSAVSIGYMIELFPDSQGAVPVRAWSAPDTSPEREHRWCLAYRTLTRGLYVRAGGVNLFGDEDWTVVAGSGWGLRGGFLTREIATGYAEAIGEAAPGIDWRVWDAPLRDMPAALLGPLLEVNKRWTSFGPHDENVGASSGDC